jgi:hypothetical protein
VARILFALLLVSVPAFPAVAADDPIITDLNKAKAAHTKELTRLRDKLLADIDAVIKAEDARGAGIDYLLKERKGFVESGVTPILPKLLPSSREYLEEKKAADAKLAKAYTVAISSLRDRGKNTESASLAKELEEIQVRKTETGPPVIAGRKVESKEELKTEVSGSTWAWWTGPDEEVRLQPDGKVSHNNWNKLGFVIRWEAIDRRTVLLVIEKGNRDNNLVAVMALSEDMTKYTGYGFEGVKISEPRKRLK